MSSAWERSRLEEHERTSEKVEGSHVDSDATCHRWATPLSAQNSMISAADFNGVVAKTGQVQNIENLFQDFNTAATVLKMAKHSGVFTADHLKKLQAPGDLDAFYEELDRGIFVIMIISYSYE